MYNYKHLLSFITVVEENSFTSAAGKLFITQPAISWQIKSLEKSIGVQLMERSDRDIQLTPAGELLYHKAKIIIDQYHQMKEEMDSHINSERNLIRLAASTIPGEYILPNIIKAFKDQHAPTRVKIHISDSKAVVHQIINGLASIGVLGSPPNHPDLEVSAFLSESLKLVCSSTFKLDQATDLEKVLKEPLIMREEGSGTRTATLEHIKSTLPHYKFEPNHLVFGSTKACLSAIEAGLGIGWLSEYAIDDSLKLNRVHIVNETFNIQRQLYIITHKKRTLNETSKTFIDFLKLT